MLRTGAILLSLWAALHLVVSLGILAMVLVGGRNAPALTILFGNLSGNGLDPRALATINYLAVLCNAWRGAFSVLALFVIWSALARRARWSFWGLAVAALLVQAASIFNARLLLHGDPGGEVLTTVIVLAGLSCAAWGLFRRAGARESGRMI